MVELAGIGPAPYACMLLADAGADVLRIDRARRAAGVRSPARSTGTCWTGAGARSAVDLKHPDGVDLVLDLVARADVLVEGFRPGVTERLGLGPDDCCRRNPGSSTAG